MKPEHIIELSDGIEAVFSDGARITLTLEGTLECTLCQSNRCQHFREAVPYFARRKWALAEANRERWSPQFYQKHGLDPRIFFRPGEGGSGRIGWPDDCEILVWRMPRGFVATFPDGGHVYVGDDHPEGQTRCLKCGTLGCGHYQRALVWMRAYGNGELLIDRERREREHAKRARRRKVFSR